MARQDPEPIRVTQEIIRLRAALAQIATIVENRETGNHPSAPTNHLVRLLAIGDIVKDTEQ